MAETINFPNGGFEIIVVKRKDILDCINANIKDKEIMEELISNLEITADKYLSEGNKISIPFIGTIRKSPAKLLDKKNKQLYKDATKFLNKKDYILLRKSMAKENDRILRYARFYKYQVGVIIRNHISEYRRLVDSKGELKAKLTMYFKYSIKSIDNIYGFDGDEFYNPIDNGES